MLFPTLVVYGCTVPAFVFINHPNTNLVWIIGMIISLIGICLELAADAQMRAFKRTNTDKATIIRTGLWRNARHPNYLGEILMWWGIYITAVAAAPSLWWLGVGALVNTAMFVFITIPMADRRNRSLRNGFDEYWRQTRSLLPIPLRPGRPSTKCRDLTHSAGRRFVQTHVSSSIRHSTPHRWRHDVGDVRIGAL